MLNLELFQFMETDKRKSGSDGIKGQVISSSTHFARSVTFFIVVGGVKSVVCA